MAITKQHSDVLSNYHQSTILITTLLTEGGERKLPSRNFLLAPLAPITIFSTSPTPDSLLFFSLGRRQLLPVDHTFQFHLN